MCFIQKYGLSCDNCIEKADLVSKLRDAHIRHQKKVSEDKRERGLWISFRTTVDHYNVIMLCFFCRAGGISGAYCVRGQRVGQNADTAADS